ncbi:alpha/beta fold hydrolase [Flavobacteriaceae bacterium Ap0902]|nr:alpha/beta fold hydrolase [Flavobacteriaceae bacterium Ap0902]
MAEILFSKIIGDKPQHLIIVHGLFGQLDNWNTLGKKFANNFTTHLVDLRNHGRSFHDDDTSHAAMADDLVAYLASYDIEKASFIGHSLGGKVVMDLALRKPELVHKLIVADMAPKSYPPHHQDIIAGLKNVDFSKVKTRSDVEPFMQEYIKDKGVRQFLLKNVYRVEDGKYAFRFNLKALSETYDDLVSNKLPNAQFNKPTLFLKGQNSDYITMQDRPVIETYFPQAQIEIIPNAGHWVHAENPKAFLEKSLDFLLK